MIRKSQVIATFSGGATGNASITVPSNFQWDVISIVTTQDLAEGNDQAVYLEIYDDKGFLIGSFGAAKLVKNTRSTVTWGKNLNPITFDNGQVPPYYMILSQFPDLILYEGYTLVCWRDNIVGLLANSLTFTMEYFEEIMK